MNEEQLAVLFQAQDVGQLGRSIFAMKLRKYFSMFLMRILDLLGGIIGCIGILPIMIAIVIYQIKDKDFGPIFFSQMRIGKNGKPFKMYKFRTMVQDADIKLEELLKQDEQAKEEYNKYKKLKNDPRVTRFGEFLRKTSLDEFPQFFNVLKGEMTLVGPRPYLLREKEDMGKYYDYIIKHKPGITGYWQISGRNDVTFADRLDIDVKYHTNKSLSNDIKILLITVLITIKRKGAV